MAKGVKLEVNGKEVRLKDFPMRALKNTIAGYIKSLNLEEEPKEIKIHIILDEEDKGSS
jgi:ribosomal protein S17E